MIKIEDMVKGNKYKVHYIGSEGGLTCCQRVIVDMLGMEFTVNCNDGDKAFADVAARIGVISKHDLEGFSLSKVKPFDISEYEFSDTHAINGHNLNGDGDLSIWASETIQITKKDATAIARHFKLI